MGGFGFGQGFFAQYSIGGTGPPIIVVSGAALTLSDRAVTLLALSDVVVTEIDSTASDSEVTTLTIRDQLLTTA